MKACNLLIDTHASITPLMTHGNAFRGPISMLNKATLVNTCKMKPTSKQLQHKHLTYHFKKHDTLYVMLLFHGHRVLGSNLIAVFILCQEERSHNLPHFLLVQIKELLRSIYFL